MFKLGGDCLTSPSTTTLVSTRHIVSIFLIALPHCGKMGELFSLMRTFALTTLYACPQTAEMQFCCVKRENPREYPFTHNIFFCKCCTLISPTLKILENVFIWPKLCNFIMLSFGARIFSDNWGQVKENVQKPLFIRVEKSRNRDKKFRATSLLTKFP